jgi:hypothetical protein
VCEGDYEEQSFHPDYTCVERRPTDVSEISSFPFSRVTEPWPAGIINNISSGDAINKAEPEKPGTGRVPGILRGINPERTRVYLHRSSKI